MKAEAERREAELQEKLKKEEEERLARKKRIEEINAKNLAHNGSSPSSSQSPAEADIEKGALDSISSKSDENDNSSSSPLITTVENHGGESPVKKLNGLVEGTSFDQILDLGSVADTNKSQTEIPVSAPIMAFEESIQQQNNNNTAAELLS